MATFLLDQHVPSDVGRMLRSHRHNAHTTQELGLADADDDVLTVTAHQRRWVVVTLDVDFSRRRASAVIGHHVWIRCQEWEAAGLLEQRLDDILVLVERFGDLLIRLSADSLTMHTEWE